MYTSLHAWGGGGEYNITEKGADFLLHQYEKSAHIIHNVLPVLKLLPMHTIICAIDIMRSVIQH